MIELTICATCKHKTTSWCKLAKTNYPMLKTPQGLSCPMWEKKKEK